MKQLNEDGIRVNEDNFRVGLDQIEYLRFIINNKGLQLIRGLMKFKIYK